MKFKKYVIAGLLAVSVISTISSPIMTANENFGFTIISNTDTSYNVCTWGSNEKLYAKNKATVKTTSNSAPGWGMAFCMKHISGYRNGKPVYQTDTVTSPAYWIRGKGIVHPAYIKGHNITHRRYYVAGRIDNDYYGNYSAYGKFNSDYTNP